MKNLLLLILIFCSSCRLLEQTGKLTFNTKDSNVSSLETAPPFNDIIFQELNQEIFSSQCIRCHNPKSFLERGRLDLTDTIVIKNNADEIIYRISKAFEEGQGQMPPRGTPASSELLLKFSNWAMDPIYTNLERQLFNQSCTQCHNPDRPRRIDLTNKENILFHQNDILYRMDKAYLENNRPMPPLGKGDKVENQLIELFKFWMKSAN